MEIGRQYVGMGLELVTHTSETFSGMWSTMEFSKTRPYTGSETPFRKGVSMPAKIVSQPTPEAHNAIMSDAKRLMLRYLDTGIESGMHKYFRLNSDGEWEFKSEFAAN
jgi:hypothetical protein